jgi:hypothetical protein
MGPPPPVPLSSKPQQSGPVHLTKSRPQPFVDTSHQFTQPHFPSPRSSSQPSPVTKRLHKATPPTSGLSPASQCSPAPSSGISPQGSPLVRPRSHSLLPPTPTMGQGHTRVVSSPANEGRSASPGGRSPDGRGDKRKSWIMGGRSRASSRAEPNHEGPELWIAGTSPKMVYVAQHLLNGEKVRLLLILIFAAHRFWEIELPYCA